MKSGREYLQPGQATPRRAVSHRLYRWRARKRARSSSRACRPRHPERRACACHVGCGRTGVGQSAAARAARLVHANRASDAVPVVSATLTATPPGMVAGCWRPRAAFRGSRPACLGACAGRVAPARVDCTCLSAHHTYFSARCTCHSGRRTHLSACGDLRQQWWTLASALAGLIGAVVVTCRSVRRTHFPTSRTRRSSPGASPSRTPDLHQR